MAINTLQICRNEKKALQHICKLKEYITEQFIYVYANSLQNVILKLQAMKRNRDTEENKGSLS